MITRTVPFSALGIDTGEIYRSLGYGATEPPQNVKDMVGEMTGAIGEVCHPSYGYVVHEHIEAQRTKLKIDGTEFFTGSIIADYLQHAENLALFVATAGVEFERWLREMQATGDVWNLFLADSIGSEIAEAAARAAAEDLKSTAAKKGMRISNSYSPGYCGWSVREQQKLFGMLPAAPCGITLTESSLMVPIKSVSGIIALGKDIEKKPYGCEICEKGDCYKKRIMQK